eukprot:scaffold36639_cov32-Tisochrysis_lutea.AAC.3
MAVVVVEARRRVGLGLCPWPPLAPPSPCSCSPYRPTSLESRPGSGSGSLSDSYRSVAQRWLRGLVMSRWSVSVGLGEGEGVRGTLRSRGWSG